MVDQGTLGLVDADIISSLRRLWKSKTANLSEDEIEEQRADIKSQIHKQMVDVVEENITGLDRLRSFVNEILTTTEQNLERKAEHLAKFEDKYNQR